MSSTQIGLSLSPHKSKFGPILFAGNLEGGLEHAHQLGYDGVEISLLDSRLIDKQSLVRKLKDLNLQVFAIATGQTYYTDGYALYHSDPEKRRMAVQRIKGHIDLAADLEAKVILGGIRGTIDKSESKSSETVIQAGYAAIEQCVKYAESQEIVLLLEPVNRYETAVINTVEEGLKLIEQIGSRNLKILPDTFHMNIEEPSITGSIFHARSWLGYIHFADSNRWAPGLGHVDFSSIMSMLRKVDYEGPIGVEILPKPDDLTAAIKAIQFLRSLIKNVDRDR
jgi:sugar phosphate isomerase/epimerase